MPLFETVLQEKPAIVLEIGTALAKLGFGGEPYPRCIVPSVVLGHEVKMLAKPHRIDACSTTPMRRSCTTCWWSS
uniref:Putative arp11 n=1 Tax=Anopheles aquasalis TaxID=42839 RepID=T1E879_ANOAQ